jgi:hypothetical protein
MARVAFLADVRRLIALDAARGFSGLRLRFFTHTEPAGTQPYRWE